MTTWSIELTPANHQQLNDVLRLGRSKSNRPFRNWFGALAGEIFKTIQSGLNLPLAQTKSLDKTQVQHILIQAAMVQQQCMHHYRVNHDLSVLGLTDLALHDLLLFIRMSHYHPNFEDLLKFQQHSHVIESLGHLQGLLNQLQDQQLIQKIPTGKMDFYDKNPYPHCHLLDTKTGRISDYDCHLDSTHSRRFQRIPHTKVDCY